MFREAKGNNSYLVEYWGLRPGVLLGHMQFARSEPDFSLHLPGAVILVLHTMHSSLND